MATNKLQQKLGLALSGGGFRASYFHIGVLAQMAEQGLLRDVEVISAVSGGSIIAALYYLHAKKLLESKPDDEVKDQDYIDLVKRIETDFKKATDRNIRLRTFADFRSNLKMAAANYSRSDRISELYNAYLYRNVLNDVSDPVQMRELKIHPPGEPDDFHPRTGNARRKAKVPILNLNATVLNNGQDWQFTAQTMGEPLGDIDVELPETVTPADIYRRAPSYANIAPHQQNFELGHAVGASACVPGLFPPLAVSGLYRDEDDNIRIQLVDGGVYDNQGIEALLWTGCTHFIVSDASLQLAVEDEPDTDTLPVLLRASNCVTPDRLRSETLDNLFDTFGRDKTAFMHLRKDLGIRKIPWIDQDGKPAEGGAPSFPPETGEFGIAPEIQELLATVRTDLDAFSEVEAYSLMLDGYRMSAPELDAFRDNNGFGTAQAQPLASWSFLAIAPKIDAPSPDLLKQLKVSGLRFGKAMMLIPALSALITALMLLLLVLLWPLLKQAFEFEIPLGVIAVLVAVVAAYQHLMKWERMFAFVKPLRLSIDAIKRIVLNVVPALLLMPVIWIYLRLINPLYLWRGRVDNLDLSAAERWKHFLKWLRSNAA
ncbi:patatin-like phospholipase family protein [Methylomicrobium album]|uniref:Putative esterase of the alpha-beta hydrolase superfamily n=1 Tax=Methylomicrobium album BG8 TaxID=686340 RepID=H8GIM7_METAL|nr:patatin-like phospholipase family protein [Methylomicrobium album]EIC29054.1 putative esterase of the alpha-beta hydrolase superfamily [Methylomicrobium album BG8]